MLEQQTLDFSPTSTALQDKTQLFSLLDAWVDKGWLRALDSALATFFAELDEHAEPLVLLATALASHQLGHGHVCLDLAATLANPDFALSLPPEGDEAGMTALPSQLLADIKLVDWCQQLQTSSLVASAQGDSASPLVLDDRRLYLRRYWRYEQAVAQALMRRLTLKPELPCQLSEQLEQLFPEPLIVDGQRQTDWQKLACALAVRGNFSLITGGPGTGKTTTVVRLLALLQQAAGAQPLRIRLAAPTGKAAARLTESIAGQIVSLPVSEAVRGHIPSEVTTLHRLLGSLPNSRHFRHHSANLLPLDVLVVDEASMIDLEMMASLLAALPLSARLILLGDKDQLASVEAGALLGDLCRDAEIGRYDPAVTDWLAQVSGEQLDHPALLAGSEAEQPLSQRTLMLRYSRRFGRHSGIGQLALAVNSQDAIQARVILNEGRADLRRVQLRDEQDKALNNLLLNGWSQAPGYGHYLRLLQNTRPDSDCGVDDPAWSDWAGQVLSAFDNFRLLCALRKGPWGVEGLNERIAAMLHRRGLLSSDQGWYEGRPVLVTRNDYSLGLMNGDIGIALRLPDESGGTVLRVVFARNDGTQGLKFVLPSRLNAIETVFAMTVHKSQGSEFAHTALIIPDSLNPVLTKELLYTGITRARLYFSLIETRPKVFEQAVQKRVERRSGLLAELTSQKGLGNGG